MTRVHNFVDDEDTLILKEVLKSMEKGFIGNRKFAAYLDTLDEPELRRVSWLEVRKGFERAWVHLKNGFVFFFDYSRASIRLAIRLLK